MESGAPSRLARVSESWQPAPPSPAQTGEAPDAEGGEQSASLPVLAGEAHVVSHAHDATMLERRAVMPTVQAAAVAAGGFVAGAAVVGLVHRRQRRAAALVKGRRVGRRIAHAGGSGKAAELVQIVSSRSLLVDVHLLGGSSDGR
jgi:hypothetical protein